MINTKNILLSVVIMSTAFSHYAMGEMSKEEAKTLENRMVATGGIAGGIIEATAVFKYAKHSPSTSKMRLPLACLTTAVASLGGMFVGMIVGVNISKKTIKLMDQMTVEEDTPELLMPHGDKKEIEEIVHQKS